MQEVWIYYLNIKGALRRFWEEIFIVGEKSLLDDVRLNKPIKEEYNTSFV